MTTYILMQKIDHVGSTAWRDIGKVEADGLADAKARAAEVMQLEGLTGRFRLIRSECMESLMTKQEVTLVEEDPDELEGEPTERLVHQYVQTNTVKWGIKDVCMICNKHKDPGVIDKTACPGPQGLQNTD